ncbi:hypothetical protein [Cryptosporangium minutisporangium]|uniref:Aminoglycoside phosphotransferase domain-containing protein n=1 Tax=Cryptosporangium minutisporangium TaxID=113569 RepID=A0ABP6T248_9ACTN
MPDTEPSTSGVPPVDADALNTAAAEALRARFGPLTLTELTPLAGSTRARVFRARLVGRAGVPTSVIVKAPVAVAPPRERVALDVLTRAGVPGVPELLAAADVPELLVLADAGTGSSLADRLIGSDPDAAGRAVLVWAEAMARFQAATVALGPTFTDALAALTPLGPPPTELTRELLSSAAAGLVEYLPRLGVIPRPAALDALRQLADGLDPDAYTLDPGDACPDNNVETAEGLVLIDFEFAEYRHAGWQAAYLRVPWPSCWCSWRLPAAVADRALDTWRRTLAPALPAIASDRFDRELELIVAGWILLSVSWFLPAALDGDASTTSTGRPRPTRRQLIQHRLGQLARAEEPGELVALAAEAHAATERAWGRVPLPLAPAWR